MKNIILLSPPSAGKGTISSYLINKYNYNHYSIGDILRKKAESDNKVKDLLKSGNLLKDDLIISLIKDFNIEKPFILDGFPRTISQVSAIDQFENYIVIYIDIPKEVALKRALARKVCLNCNLSYSNQKKCDKCGGLLVKREDDTEEAFLNRYDNYEKETKPLIEYFKNKNLLYKISNINIDNTYNQLERLINDNNI